MGGKTHTEEGNTNHRLILPTPYPPDRTAILNCHMRLWDRMQLKSMPLSKRNYFLVPRDDQTVWWRLNSPWELQQTSLNRTAAALLMSRFPQQTASTSSNLAVFRLLAMWAAPARPRSTKTLSLSPRLQQMAEPWRRKKRLSKVLIRSTGFVVLQMDMERMVTSYRSLFRLICPNNTNKTRKKLTD